MLPGRLTTFHIDKAVERGDSYISYKGTVYSIEELRELDEVGRQRSSRIRTKRSDGKGSDKGSGDSGAAVLGERSDQTRASESPKGQRIAEIGSSSPS